MQLRELFNKPAPWEWSEQNPARWQAQFNVNNVPYTVNIDRLIYDDDDEDDEYGAIWNVVFFDESNGGVQFDITGKLGSYSIDVFSTVLRILLAFKKEHLTSSLRFTAKEPSRQKLYDRIVSMLQKMGLKSEIDSWNSRNGKKVYVVR